MEDKMIKLTMVTFKVMQSPLATEQDRDKVKLSELTESDMIAKEAWFNPRDIHIVTLLDDPIPIAQCAINTPFGNFFLAETAKEVVQKIHGSPRY